MKRDVMHHIIGFILKYVWIFCFILVVLELVSTLYSAQNLMKQTAQGVMQSVGGEISGRVDGVLRLLTGLTNDERFADTDKSLFDRAKLARPYKESYHLFMIAITDKDVNVISTNERDPINGISNLAHRDYMQKLYSTGTYQITNAFPAGADGVTMNYTIAVPILKDGKTEGSIFGSIYFDDIENILERNTYGISRSFSLWGSDNTFMAGRDGELYGKKLVEVAHEEHIIGAELKDINKDFEAGNPTNFWKWGKEGLCYITSMRVEPADWTLAYQIQFSSVVVTLLPVLFLKVGFYILLCIAISLFGRQYIRRHLDSINHLLNRVTAMQKELFQSEQTDYDSLLDMTQKGFTDQLTGLPTRIVLLNRVHQYVGKEGAYGAIFFLDLDDLKQINDFYGHEAGDCALVHFAQVLKQYVQRYQGICARYGGDEFLLLINGVAENDITKIADELCITLNTMLHINEKEIVIHGSVGISCYPQHGDKIEELISKADFALYDAKRNGKNRWIRYEENKQTSSYV